MRLSLDVTVQAVDEVSLEVTVHAVDGDTPVGHSSGCG